MTGALILLAVLLWIAWRLRPRKHVTRKPDGSAFVWRDENAPEDDDI